MGRDATHKIALCLFVTYTWYQLRSRRPANQQFVERFEEIIILLKGSLWSLRTVRAFSANPHKKILSAKSGENPPLKFPRVTMVQQLNPSNLGILQSTKSFKI